MSAVIGELVDHAPAWIVIAFSAAWVAWAAIDLARGPRRAGRGRWAS